MIANLRFVKPIFAFAFFLTMLPRIGSLSQPTLLPSPATRLGVHLLVDSRHSDEQVGVDFLAVVYRVEWVVHYPHVYCVADPDVVVS